VALSASRDKLRGRTAFLDARYFGDAAEELVIRSRSGNDAAVAASLSVTRIG
jgi:hypothetical protein